MHAKTFLAYDVSNYKVFFCATNCSFAIINYVAHLTNLSGYFFLLPIHFMTQGRKKVRKSVGASSNPRPFETECFVSITAKIWGRGAIAPLYPLVPTALMTQAVASVYVECMWQSLKDLSFKQGKFFAHYRREP